MTRALVAGFLLVASLGTAGALAWWAQAPATGDSGEHEVVVMGPAAEPLYEGFLAVPSATAMSLLRATGLQIEVEEYPGMGAYVRAIAGHRAAGASGWIYETSVDDDWIGGDRSADAYAMSAGERLAWRWSDG